MRNNGYIELVGGVLKQSQWRLYGMFERFLLTRGYVKKIRASMRLLCPINEKRLQRNVVPICMMTSFLVLLIFLLLFLRTPSIFSFVLSVFYTLVAAQEVLRWTTRRLEQSILRQMEKMLNDVRHFYYDTHSIVGALQEATARGGYEMQLHIAELLKVLCAKDTNAAAEEYNRLSHNHFLKLFLSLCLGLQEYGDTERNGESLFVRNLIDLRKDILNHLLQISRMRMEFAGLSMITLLPLLLLSFIRTTAIETLPELSRFYYGTWGMVLPVVYLVCTVMIYGVVIDLQELDARYQKRHGFLRRREKIKPISQMLDLWEKRHAAGTQKERRRLREKRLLERIDEIGILRLRFLEKLLYFCLSVIIGAGVFLYAKQGRGGLTLSEVLLLLLCGGFFYQLPSVRLRYRLSLVKMNMLSEVTRFQSIIMMQMYIPDITVLRILQTMEQFAFIFRTAIQECINEYSYSVYGALSRMKEAEQYEPFRRLCDKLLSVDKIGIVRAFEELSQDREHFQKQREEDTLQSIRKKASKARIIAFVPMISVIISYLILPYGMEAIRQFSMILRELSAM